MATDLRGFDLAAMLHCGNALQRACSGASTLEDLAQRTVSFLHGELIDGETGQPACALVRFFTTVRFDELPAELREAAAYAGSPMPDTHCLTLLGTAGTRAEWNDRRLSRGHRSIPLLSLDVVERAPMIARLLRDLGVDVNALVGPSRAPGLMPELQGRSYNVFHVEEARGSPHIPAQADFVVPCGIRSVVGFGGVLPRAELFAVILFSRVPVDRTAAERFRKLATDLRSRAIHFAADAVFAAAPGA